MVLSALGACDSGTLPILEQLVLCPGQQLPHLFEVSYVSSVKVHLEAANSEDARLTVFGELEL